MSLFPNSIFGRRRSKSPNHQTWHTSFPNHGFGLARHNNTHHEAAFPSELPSPIANNTLHLEWKESPEAHIYEAHLPPGLKRSDVRVEVDNDRVLCIICEKRVEMEEQRGRWHLVEVSSGHFVQRIILPENSKVDDVKAYMDDGVLTVHVPKHRVVSNRVRNLRISNV